MRWEDTGKSLIATAFAGPLAVSGCGRGSWDRGILPTGPQVQPDEGGMQQVFGRWGRWSPRSSRPPSPAVSRVSPRRTVFPSSGFATAGNASAASALGRAQRAAMNPATTQIAQRLAGVR